MPEGEGAELDVSADRCAEFMFVFCECVYIYVFVCLCVCLGVNIHYNTMCMYVCMYV